MNKAKQLDHDRVETNSVRGSAKSVVEDSAVLQDEVFGKIHDGGPNFRGLSSLGTTVLMTKAMIGLGILSIPYVFDAVGLVPGLFIVIAVQTMMIWCNYTAGQTKERHPSVWSISDVGRLVGGRIGEEVLDMIFIASAGIVGISTAFNAISLHGACTAVFVAVSAVLGFILMSIRTLDRISWLSWVGVVSILAAIFTMVIAVGLQDRPASAPQEGPWDKDFRLFKTPTFAKAMTAVSSVIFATAATPAFFSIRAEMRDPKDYTKCMFIAEGITTAMLVIVGCVLYYYCGQYVGVPAPSSAGPLLKRICYGLALPGLLMTLCIYAHLPAKYVFVRINRGTIHVSSNTRRHWISWFSCTFAVALVAYLLASAIPLFGSIVSFVGALIAPIVAIMPMGYVWLFDNWRGNPYRTVKLRLQALWALWIIVAGAFILVGGTYGAILDLISLGNDGKPWSCTDNSV